MCDLTLYRDNNVGSISVSNLFIDEFLADANDAQIKIYLYLIRMTGVGMATTISDMADKFNHTEKDVCRALRYWEKKGILSLDYDKNGGIVGIRLHEPTQIKPNNGQLVAISHAAPVSSVNAVNMQTVPPVVTSSIPERVNTITKPTYSIEELKDFKNRQDTPQLIFLAETYFKKTLSANDVRSILFYTDELGFSVDLIDYLFQYCADRKKTSFAYMDKVATDWFDHDITTVKGAKQYTGQVSNTAAKASGNVRTITSNKKNNSTFHQIEKNNYDFDMIEEQLLRQQ